MKHFDGIDFTDTPVSPRRPGARYRLESNECDPAVSIVTPFFNTGAVFRETVQCVKNQSLQAWEWIIVNDASDDQCSLLLLRELRESGDPRIRIIDHVTNSGLPAARNTGWRHATAALIFFLDSDDLIEATTVEKLAWSLESNGRSSFVSSYTVGFGSEGYLWSRGFHENSAFLRENLVTANTMVRKHVLEAVGGFDEKLRFGLEDWDLWLRCADSGYWGHTVTEFLEWYRRRPSHTDRWSAFGSEGIAAFRHHIRDTYAKLRKGKFPVSYSEETTYVEEHEPFENLLSKGGERLLVILPWLVTGGADHFNLSLVRELSSRGKEITIATTVPGDDNWCYEFARCTSDIFMLPRFLSIKDFPRFIAYLIRSRRPDVVMISNSELGYLLLPYLRSRCPAPVYIDYCHMEEPEWRRGGFPALSIRYSRYLDGCLVASHYLKAWMVKNGAWEDRIHVCRINVDKDKWCPNPALRSSVRRELGIPVQKVVILYAARLCRQKLPLYFARIIRDLRKRGNDFTALVAGDGEQGPALRRYIKRNRLESCVVFLGNVPIDRMHAVVAASDILLLPSQHEGISLAIYEAMSSGVVPVAANVGGQGELVIGGTGFLVDPGPEAVMKRDYVGVLECLISDPKLRENMAGAARERIVGHFALNQMADAFERICERALHERRSDDWSSIDALSIANEAVQYVCALGREKVALSKTDLPLGTKLYALLTRIVGPLYFWLLDRRYNWIITIKDIVRKLMRVDCCKVKD